MDGVYNERDLEHAKALCLARQLPNKQSNLQDHSPPPSMRCGDVQVTGTVWQHGGGEPRQLRTTQKRLRNDSEMTPCHSRVIPESFPSHFRVISESFPSRVSGRDSKLVAERTPRPPPPPSKCVMTPRQTEMTLESDSPLHFVLADILRQERWQTIF